MQMNRLLLRRCQVDHIARAEIGRTAPAFDLPIDIVQTLGGVFEAELRAKQIEFPDTRRLLKTLMNQTYESAGNIAAYNELVEAGLLWQLVRCFKYMTTEAQCEIVRIIDNIMQDSLTFTPFVDVVQTLVEGLNKLLETILTGQLLTRDLRLIIQDITELVYDFKEAEETETNGLGLYQYDLWMQPLHDFIFQRMLDYGYNNQAYLPSVPTFKNFIAIMGNSMSVELIIELQKSDIIAAEIQRHIHFDEERSEEMLAYVGEQMWLEKTKFRRICQVLLLCDECAAMEYVTQNPIILSSLRGPNFQFALKLIKRLNCVHLLDAEDQRLLETLDV